jgi:hypothetical protein
MFIESSGTTKELTAWSRVLLEKPKVAQLVKKSPAMYGIRRFLKRSQEPATGPYLNHMIPVLNLTHFFFEAHLNIIISSTSKSSGGSLPFRFSD